MATTAEEKERRVMKEFEGFEALFTQLPLLRLLESFYFSSQDHSFRLLFIMKIKQHGAYLRLIYLVHIFYFNDQNALEF